jgi:hypothetical protein
LDITLEELQKHMDNAHFRLHCKVIEIDELSDLVSTVSAKRLMEEFKKAVTTQEDVSKDYICKLLAGIWVYHDLGMIKFEKRTDGLAITIQEMILQNQRKLASRLIPILEHITEHISDDKVSVIK